VLDPARGSGNFPYLALKCLKDLEPQANIEAEARGLQRQVDAFTSPANMLGIELNEYAAELARVTVWIGELPWRLQHGYPFRVTPIREPLDQIECRDALTDADGCEAAWPVVSVLIANPPFVGNKRMRSELGDAYFDRLTTTYRGRVPGGADLVCYWFDKALAAIKYQGLGAAGLVATNSIRSGPHRQVLAAISRDSNIFEATSLGLLHNRVHELWSLRMGSSLEDRPRYTTTSCYDTFPFPAGLTPADTAHQRTEALPDGAIIPAGLPPAVRPHAEAIARAAKRLNALREEWLNPAAWVRREPEVVPLGMAVSPYPDRIVPREGHEADLAQRTLTKLYNLRPAWLADVHRALDAAVATAYGWADDTPAMPDEEILRRLLALNRERSELTRPASERRRRSVL